MTSSQPVLFALDVGDARGAITRVLVLLEKRCCRITRLELTETAPSSDAAAGSRRLVVGADAPCSMAHVVEAWLGSLVDVRAVEAIEA